MRERNVQPHTRKRVCDWWCIHALLCSGNPFRRENEGATLPHFCMLVTHTHKPLSDRNKFQKIQTRNTYAQAPFLESTKIYIDYRLFFIINICNEKYKSGYKMINTKFGRGIFLWERYNWGRYIEPWTSSVMLHFLSRVIRT